METTKRNKAFYYTQDWDEHEGTLVYKNAKTMKRYVELKEQQRNIDIEQYDMFVAFTKEDFKEGVKKIRQLKKGEKLVTIGGGVFGTEDGVNKYFNARKAIDKKIAAECNPAEVYVYEFNNYESGINDNGDMGAIKTVLNIFGWEVAEKIDRFNAEYSLEEIIGLVA